MHDRVVRWASAPVIPVVAIGLALLSLAWRATEVLVGAFAVVTFPLSLDYGEGIVIQQALLITGSRAYGSITEAPFIVFHYPPAYHLVIKAAAALLGDMDLVEIGRIVSLLAALAVAAAVAALAMGVAPRGRGHWLAGAAAALLLLGAWPVAMWLPLARVDMLSLAFTMGGLAVAARAGQSRTIMLGAVLLFVLGVFAKQTSLAAPTAAVAVVLACNRRRGVQMVVSGLTASLLLLGAAHWATDGGFLHHIVSHNVNRFEAGRLIVLVAPLLMHLPMLAAIAMGLMAGRPGEIRLLRQAGIDPHARALAMLLLHFAMTSAMLVLIGKSGSSINYLLEWSCSAAALVGVAVGRAVAALRSEPASFPAGRVGVVTMALALAAQPVILPPAGATFDVLRAAGPNVASTLIPLIRDAGRPVISDDMVAVLRGGGEVPWEPAIFAELASLGRWDETLIIRAIRDGQFAFAVTEGTRGSPLFDSRYNPAVADAMDTAWPRKARLGWLVLHLPADRPLPPGAVPLSRPH